MNEGKRYSFSEQTNELGEKNLVPMLPLSLQFQNQSIQEWGLLDTGATVNVLPYRMGLALGLRKGNSKTPVQLGGILARVPAFGVLLTATIDEFPPVKLVFAWTEAENLPLILGRMNFFKVFDVCFYGAQDRF
jgi:hypothetical protein